MVLASFGAHAAPYAALVMDARNGEVLHARSADRKLHPASLTKMMTLYLAFEAIKSGKISLDQRVRVSRHASRQVPSKMYLKNGQRVTIRHLIRATAVKSANDAAVALAEAIGGSERAFAQMMTERARRLGMTNTQFRNASGLTATGQYSTARDMAKLGRALFYDFPQYYNLFGRKTTHAMGKTIYNTNRRLLGSYRGADGIKTGYTNAAGFNLVSSAQRGEKRIIAVVFGGKTARWRNARVAELLDMGFKRAPAKATVRRPQTLLVRRSPAPLPRPGSTPSLFAQASAAASDALVPAAQASENPVVYSDYSPRVSPSPIARPGSEIVIASVAGASAESAQI
ncbi:MAG: D-alanyl-D-alanine carboxypeptidase family protein, partial [Pseudomonadota bacterium]